MTGYAIVLASKKLSRVQAVSTIASVAAASDVPVEVFATMEGLLPFEEGTVESGDFDVGPVGARILEAVGEAGDQSPEPPGVVGLVRAMRDPEVQSGMGFLLAVARALGRDLGEP